MERPSVENPTLLTVRDNRTINFFDGWVKQFQDKFGSKFYYDKKKFCYTLGIPIEDKEGCV